MTKLPKLLWFLCLLVACNPETPAEERVQDPGPPMLVAQRVTATVKREAAWLVHVRTEHEALVTTPEHPFATPRSGWIPAGRLVPGDRVASARFGTVRVVSIQHAKRSHPQAVFNLTVDPSHAYVVGTDQVLVHNRKCTDPAETARELEEAERKLEDLQLRLSISTEDKATLKQQIAEAKKQVRTLKERARRYQKKKQKNKASTEPEPNRPEPEIAPAPQARSNDGIARTKRAMEAIERKIREIEATGGPSQRLAELKRERKKHQQRLSMRILYDKRKSGIAVETSRERLLRSAEADYESRRLGLEAAQRELSELLGQGPRSEAERKSQAERRAALEKKIQDLQLEQDASKEILAGERRIAELTGRSPSTDAERAKIAEEQRVLSAMLSKKRQDRINRESFRRYRDDPEAWERRLRQLREGRQRRLRTAEYLADTERPRDTLELLEEELAARRRAGGSGSLEERTEYLTQRIAILEAMVELSRERDRLQNQLGAERLRRRELVDRGQDTREVDREIARLEQERNASRTRRVQSSLREKLLANLDGTARTDGPHELEEARLRELERELERELADGGTLTDERLRELERELGESELIDAEFMEEILREAGAEERSPPPERTAAVETGLQALQNELREERSAVEAADFQLANEHARLSQTQGAPGSSHYAAGAQRLAEVQQQRMQLRIDWRARMQSRLDAARQELRTIQSLERLRDATTEAELARRIELLEHEVNNPSF